MVSAWVHLRWVTRTIQCEGSELSVALCFSLVVLLDYDHLGGIHPVMPRTLPKILSRVDEGESGFLAKHLAVAVSVFVVGV